MWIISDSYEGMSGGETGNMTEVQLDRNFLDGSKYEDGSEKVSVGERLLDVRDDSGISRLLLRMTVSKGRKPQP